MGPDDKLKDVKYAMNTRMFLLFAGIFLLFNSVTSTIPYGFRWLTVTKIVTEYEEKNAENPDAASSAESDEMDVAALIQDMKTLNITTDDLRTVGIANIVMAVIRIIIALVCILFANRVDKSRITLAAVITLAVCEVVFAILMYFKNSLRIGSLLYAVLLTGFLLFGAIRMRKISKSDPGRILAVNTARRSPSASGQTPPRKKSIRERAMMGSGVPDDTAPSEDDAPSEDKE